MADEPISETQRDIPKFTELNDLVSEKIGGKVIFATDDWFATAENLLKVSETSFDPDAFTEYGKEMDGWETRRKRIPGHDWCIIQMGTPGIIHGVDIDTSFFTGNYTPAASLQVACIDKDLPKREGDRMGTAASADDFKAVEGLESAKWQEVVSFSKLQPGYKSSCHNYFPVTNRQKWTHLRLNMFPDGGIARLRVYGQAAPDWTKIQISQLIDLAAMLNGTFCVGYSNAHFGHPRNMIGPGRSSIMKDGWETARRLDRPAVLTVDENNVLQVPGSESAVFKMGCPGRITKIELDTAHFKGNYADSCYIEGCSVDGSPTEADWKMLLPKVKLSAHKQHYYCDEVSDIGVINHFRVTMAPDGGISRVRMLGEPDLK
ncbi:hypothetical protein CAPTEDRAFT_219028 [Capitella teleta]|uniref:Allantoate amidinohydrolase n=1 Tax=Capitella teleta TaxID=283909 RepID=R7TDR9_CAPTE|nr:hypothetical protein CAPTEDRAFT_219028 [Capitella teleta]|eukprot:ELT91657.1 hypothetical protein CAPTEDRAFT_219028 [Capitella teleta]